MISIKFLRLRDFLLDHNLLDQTHTGRLNEHFQRWEQFILRLWSWNDKATFCLRFSGSPSEGRVSIHLLARADEDSEHQRLKDDLKFALEVYEIGQLSDFEFDAIEEPSMGGELCVFGISQAVDGDIWVNRNGIRELVDDIQVGQLAEGVEDERIWLPSQFPGPTGSFVWLFSALLKAPSPATVSVYLRPVSDFSSESGWLEKAGSTARKFYRNEGDGLAKIAAEVAETSLQRLVASRFLVAVECLAAGEHGYQTANQIARCIEAYSLEAYREESCREGPLAPRPAFIVKAEGKALESARQSHLNVVFPDWIYSQSTPSKLGRLHTLCDSDGAAMFFRLPLSVGGGVPGVQVYQSAPDFHPGPAETCRKLECESEGEQAPSISLGNFLSGGIAEVAVDDLVKHTLVTGITGGGKTQTILHILDQLWSGHGVPFLVIEPAKKEYRCLLKANKFYQQGGVTRPPVPLIYTLGNEGISRFRLNPFEVIAGISVESHIGRLQTCLEAALGLFGPLHSILEEALVRSYLELGWQLADIVTSDLSNRTGFPTMTRFSELLSSISDERDYAGEVGQNIRAAIRGRIRPLTKELGSSKGFMFDTERSWPPPEILFEFPVILELNDLNEQNRALTSMLLLVRLREYREAKLATQPQNTGLKSLRHICVVEEAHSVMGNATPAKRDESGSPDSESQSIEAFTNLLVEIRSLGEGLIIADQSPDKLSQDVLRNTNLQIAHHIRSGDDRATMADSMIMTPEQETYLAKLTPGQAAVFYTGLHRATFIQVPHCSAPNGRGEGSRNFVSDQEVLNHMKALPTLPFQQCRQCDRIWTCDYRWDARRALYEALNQELREILDNTDSWQDAFEQFGMAIAQYLKDDAQDERWRKSAGFAWCVLIHFVQEKCPLETRPGILANLWKWFQLYLSPQINAPPEDERSQGSRKQD